MPVTNDPQAYSQRPVRMIGDAHRRQGDTLVMPVDPVAIIVMRAGKADHLPRRHVSVAAIDRVGEKAVPGVFEDELEELLAVRAVELERAVFETPDDLVFLIVGEIGKAAVGEFGAAGA